MLRSFVLAVAVCVIAAAPASALRKPKRGFQMKVGAFQVQPAQDLEVCEYRRLPNKTPMRVSGFEVRMPAGAHHFVVWAYSGSLKGPEGFPQGPVQSIGCTGLVADDVFPSVVIPIQSPNAQFRFPRGVALEIDPRQQVWLNPHMKNFTGASITPDVRFNFYEAKPGTVEHVAHGLIIGNMSGIDIPAGGDQTMTAEWTAPVNMNLLELVTHQHRLGTHANIEIIDPDGVTKHLMYENDNWEHPVPPDPELITRLVPGQKIRITCTWHNTDAVPIHFGGKTTDEMCFILGYFYRDDGDTAPFHSSACFGANGGILCPLAPVVTN